MPTLLHVLLRVALAIFTPPTDADAQAPRRFAPEEVTVDHARARVWAARVAAAVYGVDPDAKYLREGAHELLPDVDAPDRIDHFVEAALTAQTSRVPAALLVALAWGESRFDSAARPACGVMQVYPRYLDEPASACDEWRRDLRAGVRAGVREIELMLDDKRVHGNMRRALLYRACGNSAFDGSCSKAKRSWVTAALARWRALSTYVALRSLTFS